MSTNINTNITILKIGGGNAINIKAIAKDLAQLRDRGSFIIVHGANELRDSLAEQLGKEKKVVTSVSGYSSVFSDESTIDLQMLAYAGLRNKRIVETFQQAGINAVGLSGIDGAIIKGKRNSGIRTRENGKTKLLRDLSGKPKEINKPLLDLLIQNGYTPVLTVPIIDENNIAVNSENDDIVALIQSTYNAETVIQLMEAPGFLKDASDPASKIPHLTPRELTQWEQQVNGRIKRKLLALTRLFQTGIKQIFISDGRIENPVLNALQGKGTIISQ